MGLCRGFGVEMRQWTLEVQQKEVGKANHNLIL